MRKSVVLHSVPTTRLGYFRLIKKLSAKLPKYFVTSELSMLNLTNEIIIYVPSSPQFPANGTEVPRWGCQSNQIKSLGMEGGSHYCDWDRSRKERFCGARSGCREQRGVGASSDARRSSRLPPSCRLASPAWRRAPARTTGARQSRQFLHHTRIIAAKVVAPYRLSGKQGKNEAANAQAICETV